MVNKKVHILVGLVVIVAFLILLFGVSFLKDTKIGEKYDNYHVIFDKVSTLAKGDPVKLNGVSLGRVNAIELWNNRVRVSFNLKPSFEDQNGNIKKISIPKDSRVRVQNIGLMGERQIEIHLGRSNEIYKPGDIIENGYFDAGIAEAMGTIGKVFEEAEQLVLTVKSVVDSTVGRAEFVETFNGVLGNAEAVAKKLGRILDDSDPRLRRSLAHLEGAGRELETLVHSQKESVGTIVNNGVDVSERAKALMAKMEDLSAEVTILVRKVNSTEGTIGAMINDSLFYLDMRKTLNSADSLLLIIQKQGLDVNVDLF